MAELRTSLPPRPRWLRPVFRMEYSQDTKSKGFMKRMALLSRLAGIALAVQILLLGQTPTFDQRPMRGFVPTGSYAPSEIETVNAQNGDVILKIPIVSLPPGRGGL